MSQGKTEEAKLQSACVLWLWNTYPKTRKHFILIDNNATSMIGTIQKRSMGLIVGAPDTFFFWDKKLYFIEFKTIKGSQSNAQIEFELESIGHCNGYFIIRSIQQFQELIKSILK